MKPRGAWKKESKKSVCPRCHSPWRYYRKKTEDFTCRKCGLTYTVARIGLKAIFGKKRKEKT